MTVMQRLVLWCVLVACAFAAPALADNGRGRHKKLYIVPPPGAITIDGKLDDWDLSGQIEMYVVSETKEMQSAKIAAMADEDALYISGVVNDPSPLKNLHDPRTDADKAWNADACQFRLVTDRSIAFPYARGSLGGPAGEEEGQPTHLTLWYFGERDEACLQLYKTFKYKPLNEAWGTHSVVPPDAFDAKYVQHENGRGYTFEYRVPWKTMQADNPPRPGDVVSGTVQVLWSDASGIVSVGSGWAYDVMSEPGFPFQTSSVWGKMIFTKEGHVDRALVEEGIKPEKPLPLVFGYDLPEEAEVTVALFDQDNVIVRNIVAQGERLAGHVVERWDGLDMSGRPLAAGTYTWKGIYHKPIKTRHVMSVANSGTPPWKTPRNNGGWGGDYGPPTAICAAGDTLIMGWTGHEAGWGIIATDLSGKKKWGLNHKNAAFIASDGERFFAPAEHGEKHVNVYAVKDGRPLSFGNGKPFLEAPEGVVLDTEKPRDADRPAGLAYGNGVIYVSHTKAGLVATYNAKSGELIGTINVDAPGRLAIDSAGALLAVSGTQIVRVVDGKPTPFITQHIDEPNGIAVGSGGGVFISNHGKLQNVSVFDATGGYLRSIGKEGGRPLVGRFDSSGMLNPAGLAVDSNGTLWVPDAINSPKRLSSWNAKTGEHLRDFFGGCSYSPFMWIDPANPNEAFFDNCIWKIDLSSGEWQCHSTFYRMPSGDAVNPGSGGFFFPFRVFTGKNGRQYAVSSVHGFGPVLWLREGDRFRPLAFLFQNHPNPVLMPRPPFPVMDDLAKYPKSAGYAWVDSNGDMIATEDELTLIHKRGRPASFTWMDADLNLWGPGVVYRPTSISDAGVPTYDFTAPESQPVAARGDFWVDPHDGSLYHSNSGGDQVNLARWTPDGKMLWGYKGIPTWRDALDQSIPKAGEIIGTTCPLGVAGDFTGVVTYFGVCHIIRRDGVYVAKIFHDGRLGTMGPDHLFVELLAGQMVRPQGTDRTFILAGDQDCRVTEVLNLETIQDLKGGTFELTQTMVDEAAAAREAYAQQIARANPLTITRGGEAALKSAPTVDSELDASRNFTTRAAYDDKHLYLEYHVTSPFPLVTGMEDPKLLFKGGNFLDIQIASDASADAKRKTPVPGDRRIVVSQRKAGKAYETVAVVFEPKVKGFDGEAIKFESPTGSETFDRISTTDRIALSYRQQKGGFVARVTIPLDLIDLKLTPGQRVRMDVGYVYGNANGTRAVARDYWFNNSFTANVVNDTPHESRLEPGEWGEAIVE